MKKIDDIKVDLVNSKWLSFNKVNLEKDPLFKALSKVLKKDEVVYSIVNGNIILEDKKLTADSRKLAKLQEKQAKSNKPLNEDVEKAMDEIAQELADIKTPGKAMMVMTNKRIITIYEDLNKDYKLKIVKKSVEDIEELDASEDPDEQGLFDFSVNFVKTVITIVTTNDTNIRHFEFTLDQLIDIETANELAAQHKDEKVNSKKAAKPAKAKKVKAAKPAKAKKAKKNKKSKPAKVDKKSNKKVANKKLTKAVDKKKANKDKKSKANKENWFVRSNKSIAKFFSKSLQVIKKFDWIWMLIIALMGMGIIIASAIMYGLNWADKYWIPAAACELAFAVVAFVFVIVKLIPDLKKHNFDRNNGFTLILLLFVFIVSVIALTKTNYGAIEFIEYIITIIGAWVAFDGLYQIIYPRVKKYTSMTPAQKKAAKEKKAKLRAKKADKKAKAKKAAEVKAAKAKAKKKADKEKKAKAKKAAKIQKEKDKKAAAIAKAKAKKEAQLAKEKAEKEKAEKAAAAKAKAAEEKAKKEAAAKAKAEKEAARKAKEEAARKAKAEKEAKAKEETKAKKAAAKAKADKEAAAKAEAKSKADKQKAAKVSRPVQAKKPATKKSTAAKKPATKKSTKPAAKHTETASEKQRRLTYEELLRENNKLRAELEEVTTQFEMVAPKKSKKAKAKK